MNDRPTLYLMGATRMWPATRADLLDALGAEWYCAPQAIERAIPCTPKRPHTGVTPHIGCHWAVPAVEADDE